MLVTRGLGLGVRWGRRFLALAYSVWIFSIYEHIKGPVQLVVGDAPWNTKDKSSEVSATATALLPYPICGRNFPSQYSLQVLDNENEHDDDIAIATYRRRGGRLLLITGGQSGRTGNHLRQLLKGYDMAHDMNATLGVLQNSWAMNTLLSLWFGPNALDRDKNDTHTNKDKLESLLDIRILDGQPKRRTDLSKLDLSKYHDVIPVEAAALDNYRTHKTLAEVKRHRHSWMQRVFRHPSRGQTKKRDVCSAVDYFLGTSRNDERYSVVHSRLFERHKYDFLLSPHLKYGSDPRGAIDLSPDYIKSVLAPRGMLNYPLFIISDGQDPTLLDRLREDDDLRPIATLVSKTDASWFGSDMVLALLSDVFIGNPASTFSSFITKARYSLGSHESHLFLRKNESGGWDSFCNEDCVYDSNM